MPHLVAAIFKAQLTCPESGMVKHICRFISCADLEQLREGKPKHAKARECEAQLQAFRASHKDLLDFATQEARTAIFTKFDTQAARILLGKKCKHTTYEDLVKAMNQQALDVVAKSGKPPCGVSPGALPGSSDITQQMVRYSDGHAALSFQLADKGIVPKAYIKLNEAIGCVAAGTVLQVQSVTDSTVVVVTAVDNLEATVNRQQRQQQYLCSVAQQLQLLVLQSVVLQYVL